MNSTLEEAFAEAQHRLLCAHGLSRDQGVFPWPEVRECLQQRRGLGPLRWGYRSPFGGGAFCQLQVFAPPDAPPLIVVTEDGGAKFSARNRLHGTVLRIQKGAVNTEVIIGLPDGGAVAAIVTNESCESLGLAPGVTASALFKASSVILGVPA